MKFTTISKITNVSQMLIIPFLSMHYIPPCLNYDASSHHLYSCLSKHVRSKIPNISQMLFIPFLSIHYTVTGANHKFLLTLPQSVPGHSVSMRILAGGVSPRIRFRSTSYVLALLFWIVSFCPCGAMYAVFVTRNRRCSKCLVIRARWGGLALG